MSLVNEVNEPVDITIGIPKKKVQGKYVYRAICYLILMAIASAAFMYVWYDYVFVHNQTGHLLGIANLGMALGIYVILYSIVGRWMRAFKIGVDRMSSLVAAQILALAITDILEIFISLAITGQFRFFWDFTWRYFLMGLAQAVVLCILEAIMVFIYRKIFPPIHLLEIYGEHKNDLYKKIDTRTDKFHVDKLIHCDEPEAELKKEIANYDAVLINDLPSERRNRILKYCFEKNKRVYYTPKISDIILKGAEELNFFDTPLYLSRNTGMSLWEAAVKRFFDIFLSGIALIVLSPILLITALAIKLGDGGPVFFKQERCTLGGKKFMILKFRSMIVDAEKDGRPHPAGEKDDRITKVGHVIRATRVDELPQLINILKGDMSIVGPRPERVEHVEKYTQDVPEFKYRLKVKGGLTGYAQVYGKYNTTALDKIKLDMYYIINYSIRLDLQIIFETVKILFQKESTEGFTEERVEEMHDAAGNNIKDN